MINMLVKDFIPQKKEAILLEICQILKKTNAISFGTFKLSSGKVTPYYIDLRVVPSFPDAFVKIVEIFIEAIKNEIGIENFDRIAGIPTAGLPLSAIVAYNLKKPFLYVRQKKRLSGRERRVEGILMPGDKVLLIDDLITTGLSLERSALSIRAEGGIVSDALVLLDRGEGGRDRLARININLHTVLGIREVAEKLHEIGVIDDEKLELILNQIKNEKSKKVYG